MTTLADDLHIGLDPAALLRRWGLEPEGWQEDLLRNRPPRALLCCCRQAGKSSTAAAAAVYEALYVPGSLTLMLAPGQRQSSELLRKARSLLAVAAPSLTLKSDSTNALELANGSRVVSLPAREDTIRGYSGVALLIFVKPPGSTTISTSLPARCLPSPAGGCSPSPHRTGNAAGSTAPGPKEKAGTRPRFRPANARASAPSFSLRNAAA